LRTNIDIDDELMAEAMTATGAKTKRAAVEVALEAVVRRHRQRRALDRLGTFHWEGDLDEMRQMRTFDR
jgi:Arc/MetJ family transcription regulator